MKDIAEQFVDLVLKYKKWEEVKDLPPEEEQILFDTVLAAGFDPKTTEIGKLFGNYRDQDGSRTGEKFPINSLCPFKVVNQEGCDYYFATGWLDCALRRVVYGSTRQKESRDTIVEVINIEIERSIPLEPIQLNMGGDFLRECPPNRMAFGLEYFVNHTRDDNVIGSLAGVHEFCNSWMDRKRATKTHDAIACRGCHLRVLFPVGVKTYGDLRKELALWQYQIKA